MTEKRFKFRRFDVDIANINEIALYEIDNNPSDDLDESNLFYVYSTTNANVQDIVDKLNNQEERIKELEKENENQNNILEDFMMMLNKLQAEPNNKSLQMMAKDMLRMMGKEIMGDD